MNDEEKRRLRAEDEVAKGASLNRERDDLRALVMENSVQLRLLREDLAELISAIREGQAASARLMAARIERARKMAGPPTPQRAAAATADVDLAAMGEAEPQRR